MRGLSPSSLVDNLGTLLAFTRPQANDIPATKLCLYVPLRAHEVNQGSEEGLQCSQYGRHLGHDVA